MARIHDLFIVELAEVIKGYGNDPSVEDPFKLSEFYRFYELPNIAVSRENFEKMRSAQPRWTPCSETADIPDHEIIACDKRGELIIGYLSYQDEQWICESDAEMMYDPIAWMEKPEPYKGEADG